MLDHVGFTVSELERSIAFYEAALAPLGLKPLMRGAGYAGFGNEKGFPLWLSAGPPTTPRLHVAFRAANRAEVDAFYAAAMAAGATDNGPPGLRPQYHPGYYGAFVLDPDGHNVEAVTHRPE